MKLTDTEIKQLAQLGKDITVGLSCDINGQGMPCRTDRFAVIDAMIRYLLINGITSTLEQCSDGEDVDSWWKRVNVV
jgi:hypothetical protein